MKVLPGAEVDYKAIQNRIKSLSERDDLPQATRQAEISKAKRQLQEILEKANEPETIARQKEVAKLSPYRNLWQERVIKEEVKQAALDGKKKLQFPTGETAMKIEGLGNYNEARWTIPGSGEDLPISRIRPGQLIEQGDGGSEWVIIENLGNGRFKAVQYSVLEDVADDLEIDVNSLIDDAIGGELTDEIRPFTERFDISGEIDTSNPIYKFYEKEVGRYLKNKYNAKLVTDKQGVTWWEIDIDKKYKKLPIEAFAAAPLTLGVISERNKKNE